MRRAVLLLIIICTITVYVFAQTVPDSPASAYNLSKSVQVGIGIYLDPSLVQHPEIFEKIEENTGIVLLDSDLFYRRAYGYALSNRIIISPEYIRMLPVESGRLRFVRVAEYFLSLFPPVLLSETEEASLLEDLETISREVPSFYFAFANERRYVLDIVYENDQFLAFSMPGEQILFREDSPSIAAGRPAAGSTVYLLDSTSSIQHIPGEVLETGAAGFTMRADVSRELTGISVTDIKGRLYGIVENIDPLEKTAAVMRLDEYRSVLQNAGISLADREREPEKKQEAQSRPEPPPEYYDVGATFFIITRQKVKVFIGDTYYGESPVLIRDLEIGEYPLILDSSQYYFEGKIRVNPFSDTLTTIKPPMYLKEEE